jgi:GlcNAc-P-P-Und epimerase
VKILITGGSGFIGTNLVQYFLDQGVEVLNIDVQPPQNNKHVEYFIKTDVLDLRSLKEVFSNFLPTHVVHLAARTDLDGSDIDDYCVNTDGVRNVADAISHTPSIERCIFTSSKLVCATGHTPVGYTEYCPNTVYGKSKVLGENIVHDSGTLNCVWSIVRPTSIWGPWSDLPHIPYGRFFQMVAKGMYLHPGHSNPPKSYGYVGNFCFQIQKLLLAPESFVDRKTYYLSDYDTFTILEWANLISRQLRGRDVIVLPDLIVNFLAKIGDVLTSSGLKSFPLTSFRLANMRADTTIPLLKDTRFVTGDLPFTVERGVEETLRWFGN